MINKTNWDEEDIEDKNFIKSLEYCIEDEDNCSKCPLEEKCKSNPFVPFRELYSLKTIKRLQAENANLKEQNKSKKVSKKGKKTYLVLYGYEDFTLIKAENIKDCIIQFGDYTGCNSDLFLKSLKGCTSTKDYVDMYNQFNSYDINSICILQETVYEKEK